MAVLAIPLNTGGFLEGMSKLPLKLLCATGVMQISQHKAEDLGQSVPDNKFQEYNYTFLIDVISYVISSS